MSAASLGHLNQCGHPGCLCQVEPGERYCSDYCRQAQEGAAGFSVPASNENARCGCGHAACDE